MGAAALALSLAACESAKPTPDAQRSFDGAAAVAMLEALSADALEGRASGTPGNAVAREMITARMTEIGLEPVGESLEQNFVFGSFSGEGADTGPTKPGVNLVGKIEGTGEGGKILLVTAHYDHLGVRDGEIYNGADDNASGVVAMLALAEYFAANPPEHDVWFVAFDAEEQGFGGSRAFVDEWSDALPGIGLMINLDMVSRSDTNELWASGTSHRPWLKPLVEGVAAKAPVTLQMGYDGSNEGQDDWTTMSDHAPFHMRGVPYIYLGVVDHPDYHKPTDDFDKVPQEFYLNAIETVILLAVAADEGLDTLAPEADTPPS